MIRKTLLFGVLATSLFACDCKDEECKTPTITAGTVEIVACQGGNGFISLDGTEFKDSTSVRLVNGTTELEADTVVVSADGTHLDAQIPAGAEGGVVYDVIVSNRSCDSEAPNPQVTAVSGVFAFLADPDVVYNGISTQVTVYATTVQQPLPTDAVEIVANGATSPGTSLAWTPVPNKPNRVQVTVPVSQATGTYDLTITDGAGCTSTIDDALRVTDTLTVPLASVDPPFGDAAQYTSITIKRTTGSGAPFVATPRLFLNPSSGTGTAILVESVSFVDADTLTAVVAPGYPDGTYDLIVVNPDGSVGLLADAFDVQSVPPPYVATVTPSSIVAAPGQAVVVAGTSFDASATASLTCRTTLGTTLTPPAVTGTPTCASGSCSVTVTIDAGTLASGDVCVLRITNGDGSYFDYSAIGVTNSSLNLSDPIVGTDLVTARRGLVAAAGNATASSRFLYAIGGDGGASAATTPFSSVEHAPVDAYGTLGSFSELTYSPLNVARAYAGTATLGRYVYVVGGTNGTDSLASVERAMILDPVEVPHLDVGDMIPEDDGLDPGAYVYRVSAVFAANDVDNPGGESLPSDEFIIRVPTIMDKKLVVVLSIEPPKDRLGVDIPGVVGYRVYRSPAAPGTSGDSVLIGTVPQGQTSFTDDGSAVPGTERPLAIGSLGKWSTLASMGTARAALGVAVARDPVTPGAYYLYAGLGRTAAGTATNTYEYLPITQAANGHQTTGTWVSGGATVSAEARHRIGTWVADSTTSSTIPAGSTYVYFGGGRLGNGSASNVVEAGLVQAGGTLASFDDAPGDFSSNRAGYGVCGANGSLFAFGGANGGPSGGAAAAQLVTPAPSLASNSWNNEGLQMTQLRVDMGSAVQSAFIFLVGGQTDLAEATRSTELVIW